MKAAGFCLLIVAFPICGDLGAATITLPGLPGGDTDTVSIQLSPLNGAVDGVSGSKVGWGFTVNWTSTDGDWISFTGSSLGSPAQGETNPSLLGLSGYADFIGAQGGPVDFALSPGAWTQSFNDTPGSGVIADATFGIGSGVGSYTISGNPTVAVPGAQDTGQITFDFQVYNGDPLGGGTQIGASTYSYAGTSTVFSVTVDATPSPAAEPSSWVLLVAGCLVVARRGTRLN